MRFLFAYLSISVVHILSGIILVYLGKRWDMQFYRWHVVEGEEERVGERKKNRTLARISSNFSPSSISYHVEMVHLNDHEWFT